MPISLNQDESMMLTGYVKFCIRHYECLQVPGLLYGSQHIYNEITELKCQYGDLRQKSLHIL